jgi:hypothetical protein
VDKTVSWVSIAAIAIASLKVLAAEPTATTAVTACSLFSKQDAAAALGEPVTEPESKSGIPFMPGVTSSNCAYEGSGYNRVNLNVWRASADAAVQFHQMYAAACTGKTTSGLAGLGDVSCWYNEKHEELQVLKGTTFFSVELREKGDPTIAIKAVAQKVSDQLP